MEKLKHRIDLEGYPCQRPRLGKYGNTHNPIKYTKHKRLLAFLLKNSGIPKGDYRAVKLHYFFPYPASEPKKNRIDLAPYNRKYDVDNLVKSFFDALQDSGIIEDDRCICGVTAVKLFTTEKKGWIEFEIE